MNGATWLSLGTVLLSAQTGGGSKATVAGSPAAISQSKEDPAAVSRGGKLFADSCGACHGATAKGTDRGPDLVRSLLVLDDEKGILISPVMRNGRPDKGMPKSELTDAQIGDIVAWLHVQTFAADHRGTYAFLDVVTGDAKRGEAYFNGAGKCSTCHSVTGDLAGIGGRYEPRALQQRWLQPTGLGRGGGRGGRGGASTTVSITLPSGETLSGTLEYIDDFNVSFRDASGVRRTVSRETQPPAKVAVHNPAQPHIDLLRTYTDADIHDVTAYLVSLK